MSVTETKIAPIIKSVRVPCTRAKAFEFFTAHLQEWWPTGSHSISAEGNQTPETCKMEPRIGGRIFERTRAGIEHVWGTVLAWEPPARVEFTWHPGRSAETAQLVCVEFNEAADGTELVLTHTGWEKLGAAAAETREGYFGGWDTVLGCFQSKAR